MKQTSEDKVIYLTELTKIDPLLALIPYILDSNAFGKLIKTFAGHTIKFPTIDELKSIIKKTRKIRDSLRCYVRKNGCKELIGGLYDLALNIESREVRKATKTVITQIILHEYFNKLMNDNSFEIPIDKLDEFDTKESLELYRLFLKDANMKTNIIKAVEAIQKTKQNKLF